jgi:type II secretory pathway pseudopilin PulG
MELNRRQRGSIMTEVLLASAIMALITAGTLKMIKTGQDDIKAKNLAEQMQSFQQVAAQYYISNSAAMIAAMTDGTGAATQCRLGVDPANADPSTTGIQSNESVTTHTCAIDASFLKWKKLIPTSFKETNIYNQKMVAIFKLVYNAAVATKDVEMLMVGASGATGIANYAPGAIAETDISRLYTAAEIMGANGGVIPDADRVICKYTATTKQACGTQGGWTADITQFVN